MECDDLKRCQAETPEKFTACVDDDCHHCADCFKCPQKPEAVVPLNDLLVAYARLIDDVGEKAEAGRKMANAHNCDATAACQSIVDLITTRLNGC